MKKMKRKIPNFKNEDEGWDGVKSLFLTRRIKRVRSQQSPKLFKKATIRLYYQTQNLSVTENNFLLLIPQKKQHFKKQLFLQARYNFII